MCKFLLQKEIFHCMGLMLDIHLFRIKLNFVEILLYLSLLHPSIQVGLWTLKISDPVVIAKQFYMVFAWLRVS